MNKKLKEALERAENEVGGVYRCGSGPNGWGYNTWSPEHRLWYTPCIGHEYITARQNRAQAIAERAFEHATGEAPRILYDSDYWTGRASERLVAMLRKEGREP